MESAALDWMVRALIVLDLRIVRAFAYTIAFVPIICQMEADDWNDPMNPITCTIEIASSIFLVYHLSILFRTRHAAFVSPSEATRFACTWCLVFLPALFQHYCVLCTVVSEEGQRYYIELIVIVVWIDVTFWAVTLLDDKHSPLRLRYLVSKSYRVKADPALGCARHVWLLCVCPGSRLLRCSKDRDWFEYVNTADDEA